MAKANVELHVSSTVNLEMTLDEATALRTLLYRGVAGEEVELFAGIDKSLADAGVTLDDTLRFEERGWGADIGGVICVYRKD